MNRLSHSFTAYVDIIVFCYIRFNRGLTFALSLYLVCSIKICVCISLLKEYEFFLFLLLIMSSLYSFLIRSFPAFYLILFYIRQSADHTGAGVGLQTRQCLRNIRCNCSDSSFIRIWRDTPGIWGQLFFLLLLHFILVYFLLFTSKLPPLFLN